LPLAGCKRDINQKPVRIAVTSIVSLNSSGAAGNLPSVQPCVSSDGRFVAFVSRSVNLVGTPTNSKAQVYLRDRVLGTTVLVSVNDSGDAADDDCLAPSISADGKRIVFHTTATNLASDDANFLSDVYLRDLVMNQTTRLSVDDNGQEAAISDDSVNPVISADGRFVAFESRAAGLVSVPTSGLNVIRRDLQTGKNKLVSIAPGGGEPDGDSRQASISADGRYVAFVSQADDMTPLPAVQGTDQVYIRDMTLTMNAVQAVSVSTDPSNIPPDGFCDFPSLSADGRVVAFRSIATNLVAGDLNGKSDVFVRDLRDTLNPKTILASRNTSGNQANNDSSGLAISGDGRSVTFFSTANNLASGTSGFVLHAYWNDLQTGRTVIVSVDTGGEVGNADSDADPVAHPVLTSDGRLVFFSSAASDLVPFDVNGVIDIFCLGPVY
jgi:Tol biopolymer transport system component